MSTFRGPAGARARRRLSAAQVIIVSSVMFTFISYWRTAAVVLCDLASTAYYIGGIVESSIGPAAPWFILAVMLFSYAVRSVYIESCSLFVRGGVYRVVKEAMGGFLAKLSVSALMFDYVLTGPISAVSAGQYIIGLALEIIAHAFGYTVPTGTADIIKSWGSVIIAVSITLYFYRQNILGIHESSDKAMKIMLAMTVVGAVMLVWCGVTLIIEGPKNHVPWQPNFSVKTDPSTGEHVHPLGFLDKTSMSRSLAALHGTGWHGWLSLLGFAGIVIAFGHSILAMSGEETLAQVYREVESPKMKNFQKAAFIVFVYSLLLTAGISFLAVLLIPDNVRMSQYADNLIGGLAMNMTGPWLARLILNGFVVTVGFLILAGAVNTAIIGSNGVLNRVAEDGVVPDWFLKPHRRYGTTYRMLTLILVMQLSTIIASRGDVLVLGEAYAFGVVWSFVFKALAMVVLRFTDRTPREFRVPLNLRLGKIELPIGLGLIFLVLFAAAIANLLTKTTATTWGLGFTAAFLTVFEVTEHLTRRRRKGEAHQHLEQFNRQITPTVSAEALGLKRPYRKMVTIRSPNSMYMLEKALAETDPDSTDVVVMTAKVIPADQSVAHQPELDPYDQQLMTAVVTRAEHAGKQVKPLIVPTNNALNAVMQTADSLDIQELILGASNKYTAEEQLDQLSLYWINLHQGEPKPLTIRILSRYWDVYLDLGGGNRVPKLSERRARSISELRAAGVGVNRMLLIHDGTQAHHDIFQLVLTMVDEQVTLDLVAIPCDETHGLAEPTVRDADLQRARSLGRELGCHVFDGSWGQKVVTLADEGDYDLIILALPPQPPEGSHRLWDAEAQFVLDNAHCHVFLAAHMTIPTQVAD